jgi:hypothetical protein
MVCSIKITIKKYITIWDKKENSKCFNEIIFLIKIKVRWNFQQ